ncbi:MAG: ATP-binding cassette domain-containing protein [Peptococcaceae bacterium]|nr:ATP-binding cassette domain-containing protein [Peptococcaceae bacterium]
MSQGNTIKIIDATKAFKETTVFKDVTMTAEPGKITGVIGRNGSGKTVLFKCICGFMPLTSGKITVGGREVGREVDIPKDLGIIIEAPGFLPNYSGFDNLKFLATIKNNIDDTRIQEAMKQVGLDWKNKKKVRKYSLGMRQRLGIAQAIMEDQKILILDEPMNGLDREGVEDMRKLFLDLKERGKTMLMASHDAEDINVLCDRVYEINGGIVEKVR